MSVLKKILHWLAYPFVGIAFLWSMMRVKQKAKTYAKYPNSMPLEVRYEYVYKMAKRAIFLRNRKIETYGFEKNPQVPALYIANHKSTFDPIILFKYLYEYPQTPYFKFVAKKELNQNDFVSCALKLVDTIFIDRENPRSVIEVYRNQTNMIKERRSIVLFIEGTRIYDIDKIGPFHAGALHIAFNNLCPIVPVVMYGTIGNNGKYDRKENVKYVKSKKVYVECLPAIKSNDYMTTNINQLSDSLHDLIETKYLRIHKLVQEKRQKEIFEEPDQKPKGIRF